MDTSIKYPDKVIKDISRIKIHLFNVLEVLPQTNEVKILKSELEKESDVNEIFEIGIKIIKIASLVLKQQES